MTVAAGMALLIAGAVIGRTIGAGRGDVSTTPVYLELALPSFVATFSRRM